MLLLPTSLEQKEIELTVPGTKVVGTPGTGILLLAQPCMACQLVLTRFHM